MCTRWRFVIFFCRSFSSHRDGRNRSLSFYWIPINRSVTTSATEKSNMSSHLAIKYRWQMWMSFAQNENGKTVQKPKVIPLQFLSMEFPTVFIKRFTYWIVCIEHAICVPQLINIIIFAKGKHEQQEKKYFQTVSHAHKILNLMPKSVRKKAKRSENQYIWNDTHNLQST